MLVLLRMPATMSDWERATLHMRTCSELQFHLHKAEKTSAEPCSQPPRAADMPKSESSSASAGQSNKQHDN